VEKASRERNRGMSKPHVQKKANREKGIRREKEIRRRGSATEKTAIGGDGNGKLAQRIPKGSEKSTEGASKAKKNESLKRANFKRGKR